MCYTMKPTQQELEKLRTYAPGLLIQVALEEIYRVLKKEIPDLIKDIFIYGFKAGKFFNSLLLKIQAARSS